MKYLTLEETREVMRKDIEGNELLRIQESFTKDFKWGTLFNLEPAKFEETGNITGLPYFLVDKLSGEIVSIDYQQNVDFQLEKYREEKGYAHVIKFPVQGDLKNMSLLEKVLALFRTEELSQIREAIKIVEANNLFSIQGFAEVCYGRKTDRIAESISRINCIEGSYYIYDSDLKILPDEIALLKNEITSLSIYLGEIEIISDAITKLENLTSISIEIAPVKAMPFDLRNLKKLKKLEIRHVEFLTQNVDKFMVPKDCEIIIE